MFSRVLHQLAFPPTLYEGSLSPHVCQHGWGYAKTFQCPRGWKSAVGCRLVKGWPSGNSWESVQLQLLSGKEWEMGIFAHSLCAEPEDIATRVGVLVCVFNCVWLFMTPWTVAPRSFCPWNFPEMNIGSGCHFLPRNLPNPGIKSASLVSLRTPLFTTGATWEMGSSFALVKICFFACSIPVGLRMFKPILLSKLGYLGALMLGCYMCRQAFSKEVLATWFYYWSEQEEEEKCPLALWEKCPLTLLGSQTITVCRCVLIRS